MSVATSNMTEKKADATRPCMRVSVETSAPPSKLRMPKPAIHLSHQGYLGPLTPVRPSSFLSEPTNLSNDSRFYYGDIRPIYGRPANSARCEPNGMRRLRRSDLARSPDGAKRHPGSARPTDLACSSPDFAIARPEGRSRPSSTGYGRA